MNSQKSCLIIAAGKGTRLSEMGCPKPLVKLKDFTLIAHIIHNVKLSGITDFIVIVGYERQKIEAELKNISKRENVGITTVYNPQWEEGNGLSVLAGKPHLHRPFILLMSDHVFHGDMLSQLLAAQREPDETILAIDTNIVDNPQVDLDDVTRVNYSGDKIIQIGKHIKDYNAFDTGMFYSSGKLFDALEESIAAGDTSLSGGMSILLKSGLAKVYPIVNALWIDVDTADMLTRAEQLLENGQLPELTIT